MGLVIVDILKPEANMHAVLGTKAETLEKLKSLDFSVPEMVFFLSRNK